MKPVAVRSLACADHAINIPPNVLNILWFLGKRCNYDCSYCSSHIHDSVSPFINYDVASQFIDNINRITKNKKIKWSFTGGEPFLDPSFLSLIERISQSTVTEQINTISNGTLPLEVYQRASRLVAGITFSLHLERSIDELLKTINKITLVDGCLKSVNLMFVPGKQKIVSYLINTLEERSIPFIVRKITPPFEETNVLPFERLGEGRKQIRLHDLDKQSLQKNIWVKSRDRQRKELIDIFYTADEVEFLKSQNTTTWQNCGVWFDDNSYKEINSDWLVSKDLINFQGWICWAGVDSLYIDFDGQIYRGLCQNNGAISHINEFKSFASYPCICEKNWCACNHDITVRKSLPEFKHHVDK